MGYTPPFAEPSGFQFRGAGFTGTATAGILSDIDYLVASERWINGAHIFLNGQHVDDTFSFQIVDKDNVLGYGANLVLHTFAQNWNAGPAGLPQPPVIIQYPARMPAGLYIRIKYQSAGTEDVGVKINLFLHERL